MRDDFVGWMRARVSADGQASEADYVRVVVERDRLEQLDTLEAALERGRASGASGRSLADIIADEGVRFGKL